MEEQEGKAAKAYLETIKGGPGDEKERESAGFLREKGPLLIHYIFTAVKTVQIHKLDNKATHRALSELMEALRELFNVEGRAAIRISAEYLLINDIRISVDPQNFGPFIYLMEEMKKREIEGIEFFPEVSGEEVGEFLKIFLELEGGKGSFERLEAKMEECGIAYVSVYRWVDKEKRLREYSKEERDVKVESNRVFFRAVTLMKEIMKTIEERHSIQVRKAKRLTQQMVDLIQTDESILLGLASMKNFDEYTFAHSVNVCILSMVTGDRLRLYKGDIARLGLAALFHDVGKVYIPTKILNKPAKLSGQEWELMKYHTFLGVRELCRVKSMREISDALFVALQHHVHFNMNGYPQKGDGWCLHLFSRIVTIADYYDAMTSSRIYRQTPLTPDKVLRFVLLKSGEIFDPFIAKVFVQAMGIYPVGTLVELDTGEQGVVVKQNLESRFMHRPSVKVFSADSDGTKIVDLTERTPKGDRYRRSIVRTIHEDDISANKKSFFCV